MIPVWLTNEKRVTLYCRYNIALINYIHYIRKASYLLCFLLLSAEDIDSSDIVQYDLPWSDGNIPTSWSPHTDDTAGGDAVRIEYEDEYYQVEESTCFISPPNQ